ncbi:MAG TPA: holo-ACP synthase [Mycobacteriales bacterium]|nr:holo-ACP synthase [Mycobacteriales bacterium]
MPVIGVGVDVCSIDRVETMLARTPATAERLFTAGELSYAEGSTRSARLAARFAAKEATAKSLGGVDGMTWHDVEVVGDGGAPTLLVTGSAAARAHALGVRRWHLSLSHDAGVAVAMVVAEG